MYPRINASPCKKAIKTLLVLLIVLFMYSSASAQHVSDALTYGGGGNGDPDPNGWGITASGGYDATRPQRFYLEFKLSLTVN